MLKMVWFLFWWSLYISLRNYYLVVGYIMKYLIIIMIRVVKKKCLFGTF